MSVNGMETQGAPVEINKRAGVLQGLFVELLEKGPDGGLDEGLYDAIVSLTTDAILEEDIETLKVASNGAEGAVTPAYGFGESAHGRLHTIRNFANWAIQRQIAELNTPEEHDALTTVMKEGYLRFMPGEITPMIRGLLQSSILSSRQIGEVTYVEATPKGKERFKKEIAKNAIAAYNTIS